MNRKIYQGYLIPIIGLLILSIIISCDHPQEVSGIVKDLDTKKPIDSVYVYRFGKMYNKTYSDTNGSFVIKDNSGLPFGYNKIKIIFEKNGYKKRIVKFKNNQNLKIYLKKE